MKTYRLLDLLRNPCPDGLRARRQLLAEDQRFRTWGPFWDRLVAVHPEHAAWVICYLGNYRDGIHAIHADLAQAAILRRHLHRAAPSSYDHGAVQDVTGVARYRRLIRRRDHENAEMFARLTAFETERLNSADRALLTERWPLVLVS